MSRKERDSIVSDLHNGLAPAEAHHALLIEKLRLQKNGFKRSTVVVKRALKDSGASVKHVPECPDRHEVQHTLLELKRAAEKVRKWEARI